MGWIETVTGQLDCPRMVSLTPPVEPDEEEGEDRKPLRGEKEFMTEQPEGQIHVLDHHKIDEVNTQCLSQPGLPIGATAQMKEDHRQHTGAGVIHHGDRSHQKAQKRDPCNSHHAMKA